MNGQLRFDPMTGQPLNQNNNMNNNLQNQNMNQGIEESMVSNAPNTNNLDEAVQYAKQPSMPIDQIQQPVNTYNQQVPMNQNNNIQQQIHSIPNVEQNKQEFINNTQAVNLEKKNEKKDTSSVLFIVILFVVIFAAIFFLFPYLLKILG